jgi:hypothetical protein
MKDRGRMTYAMVLESRYTLMEIFMKVDGNGTRYHCHLRH